MTTQPRKARKLPVKQLTILAICRFAEPISITSVLPYLPSMVHSFGVDQQDVGKWAGICSATFSISQAIMGVPWGRVSDMYGRKYCILLGLTSTMITTLAWGLSRSLPFAIVVRAIAGAGNGNVGIIRTTVAEMVPYKELQPRAFSIMPLVWNIGSVLGPAMGGTLANPYNVEPGQNLDHPSFLQTFPYALPNIVSACFFLVGITVGFLFLEETMEAARRGRRDLGLRIGDKFIAAFRRVKQQTKRFVTGNQPESSEEYEPFIKATSHEESQHTVDAAEPRPPPPSFREVLNKQAVLNLIVYTLLAMHSMAFDQLLPVYLQYPSLYSDDDVVTRPISGGNPLKFAGGAGLDHFTIGLISTGYGVFGMLVQFSVYPIVARRYGVLNCLKICTYIFPIAWFLMPITALIPDRSVQIAACFAIILIKCSCAIFAFPCSTILLTNSASSARTLGTLNGFATSMSAIGRAAGPALGGFIFSSGVRHGYVIAPWWTLMAFSIIAAVPVGWLVESDGFGGEDETNDESDSTEEEQRDETAAQETTPSENTLLQAPVNTNTGHGTFDAPKSSPTR